MSLSFDPVEETPKFQQACAAVEEAAWAAVEAEGIPAHSFGSCHRFWAYKKRLLWRDHGIRWRTPTEMNPGVMFD